MSALCCTRYVYLKFKAKSNLTWKVKYWLTAYISHPVRCWVLLFMLLTAISYIVKEPCSAFLGWTLMQLDLCWPRQKKSKGELYKMVVIIIMTIIPLADRGTRGWALSRQCKRPARLLSTQREEFSAPSLPLGGWQFGSSVSFSVLSPSCVSYFPCPLP